MPLENADHPTEREADADPADARATTEDSACTLCGLPTPAEPITDDAVDGTFCCRGCLEVVRTFGPDAVDGNGQEFDEESSAGRAVREALGADDERDIADADGETTFLAVDGMHCSTCEAFLEARAGDVDGVEGARASYATDTVRVVHDPDRVAAADLPDALSGMGYEARRREAGTTDGDDGTVRFLLGGGLFGMMVMVWYAFVLYPTYLGYAPLVDLGGPDGRYLFANVWLLTTVVLCYAGYPILRGALVSLRTGRPNMDLLVSLAACAAYAYSTLAMLVGETHLYFDVTVAIVLAVTAGNYYEDRVKRRATGLLSDLAARGVEEATLAESGETVPVDDVDPGDALLVRPGDRVPLDGTVDEGSAAVDESLVTGEALPVEKSPGDPVRGGTVVTDAPLVVRVGEDASSTLDRLVTLLWTIQSSRPGVQRLADRLAAIFVPLVAVLAIGSAGAALALGASPAAALLTGLTVLIVSCPCALGLATPLAIASGVEAAARRGIVVAAASIFEDAPDVDVVALDKTGTLTAGTMSVTAVETIDEGREPGNGGDDTGEVDENDPGELLRTAAAVERFSEHPIATAIVDAAREGPDEPAASAAEFDRHRRGVSGVVDGRDVVVGHPALFDERGWSIPSALAATVSDVRSAGDVPVVVGWDGRARGVIAVGDLPRSEWTAAVEALSRDREVIVLTGDEGRAADRFRDVAGVDDVFAGVPPDAKAETVRRLGSRGTVAMVGDGSNDAPALAAADVGIAMGSGTRLATDAADAVVVSDDLEAAAETLEIATATDRRIRQNLAWAFCYNAVAIPLAVAGLLNPLFAAVAMATSSLLVVVNSTRSLAGE